MRYLKIILGCIYPVLIILLLLSGYKSCNRNPERAREEKKETTEEPDAVEKAQRTGRSGNLKITLLWNFQGDIDLHVTQPNGKTIYYEKTKDGSTGGFLDVDNREGGNGAAENIFWENPPKGEYQVSLVYYQPSETTNNAESGMCTVVVFQQGKSPQTYQVEMNHINEKKNIVKLNIQ